MSGWFAAPFGAAHLGAALWAVGGLLGLLLLRAIGYRFSRVVGLIVLAGQLPGDIAGFADKFAIDPRGAARSLTRADVWNFLSAAALFPRKMAVLGPDATLVRLGRIRASFEAEGWQHVQIRTADGLNLDGAMHAPPPPDSAGRQRWVVFFNANMQKYEEWLFYFNRYAREAKVGMLVFNWRGVGHSDGFAASLEDLVTDGSAALAHVLGTGADPQRVLIHGLSIGACVAALVRARQPAERHGPVLLDRAFCSLSAVLGGYAEFALGPAPAKQPCGAGAARAAKCALLELLAGSIWLILLATGWEVHAARRVPLARGAHAAVAALVGVPHGRASAGSPAAPFRPSEPRRAAPPQTTPPPPARPRARQGRTLRGFRALRAPRIVTFHRQDNIIHFGRASLVQRLEQLRRAGRLAPPVDAHAPPSELARADACRWHALELTTANDEWLPHDMPLFLDREWPTVLALVRGALAGPEAAAVAVGLGEAKQGGGAVPGARRHGSLAERFLPFGARGRAPSAQGSVPSTGAYSAMI